MMECIALGLEEILTGFEIYQGHKLNFLLLVQSYQVRFPFQL